MPEPHASLILASSSPRRRQILESIGLNFDVRVAPVDESRRAGEPAGKMVIRVAGAKALAIPSAAHEYILAADTAVVLEEEVFGKPRDEVDAVAMLSRLSGRTHEVLTGVALRHGDELRTALSTTEVRFRDIDPDEARDYWHSGEPADKAGAYAIQGIGGIFVEAISGSFSGVVGLPVFETARLLGDGGFDVRAAFRSGGRGVQ